jgi:putative oxidoreductase
MTIVDRFTALAPRILGIWRIIMGTMFACHGAMKLFGVFGGMPPGVPAHIKWGAGSLEFFGGILIALGLFTRITAFIDSGLMAFAYFIGHAPGGFWPIVNGGAPAIMYCWFFLYIAAHGPGAFALDNLRVSGG